MTDRKAQLASNLAKVEDRIAAACVAAGRKRDEVTLIVVTKTYPKKAPIRARVSGRWLLDLKTSKGVYPSYKIQVAAYAQGLYECGYGLVDHAGIVRVTEDGRYELVEAKGKDGQPATYEDFVNVLETHRTIERLK